MAEYIYGKNTVIEMIKSGHKIEEVLVTELVINKEPMIHSLIKKANITYQIVGRKQLDRLVKGNHQGIICKIAPFPYYEITDMLNVAKQKNENPFIVILDGLEDPHNLGAILRTADCSGVHGIIIPKNRSVSLNATVAKLSTGAIKYVKVAKVTNLTNTIKQLKKMGLWIIGCDMDTKLDYRQMDAKAPIALVIGSEGKGISRLVKENCDMVVKLPMKGHITSLNASVATSIILYEVLNQRCPL
ncbi:23S rRNA (guanosine(2251)-2'-O)-methyltransferase RlmB [Mycoplasmatota bacterium]|nr:23S rRNA (guanosine(2251)-2'-O)-methyltransferase RlmB [Mycoplasmatota bacterium]